MNTNQFCVWLKGYLEAIDSDDITSKQVDNIKKRLDGVFEHLVDNTSTPKEHKSSSLSGVDKDSFSKMRC